MAPSGHHHAPHFNGPRILSSLPPQPELGPQQHHAIPPSGIEPASIASKRAPEPCHDPFDALTDEDLDDILAGFEEVAPHGKENASQGKGASQNEEDASQGEITDPSRRPPGAEETRKDIAFTPSFQEQPNFKEWLEFLPPLERDLYEAEFVEARVEVDPTPVIGSVIGSFRPAIANPSPAAVKAAEPLRVNVYADSARAYALCDRVEAAALAWERTNKPRRARGAAGQGFRRSVEAIIGSLLLSWGRRSPKLVFQSLDKVSFTGTDVSARQFVPAMKSLQGAGLVTHWRVFRRGRDANAWLAGRYYPTQELLDLAQRHGVEPASVRTDFRIRPPAPDAWKKVPRVKQPVRLTSLGKTQNLRPRSIPFDPKQPSIAKRIAEVEEHNAFAAGFDVQGCVPPRWHRAFRGNWGLGGRWYSAGPAGMHYQNMPEARRLAEITINGEPVAELDIHACNLTLAHGALGIPVPDGDLYDLGSELPRNAVKTFINASIGNGAPLKAWPEDHREKMAKLGHRTPARISEAVLARYPFFRHKLLDIALAQMIEGIHPSKLAIHRCEWLESAVITEVMRTLRADGVLALPMHDGIIVPVSAAERAKALLLDAGERIAKVQLRVTVDVAPEVGATAVTRDRV